MQRPRTSEEDDRLAAIHEAAHAVFAIGPENQPILLADAVEITGRGFGAAAIGLDTGRLKRLAAADQTHAREILIWAFLAGGVAETRAARLWNIPLTPSETAAAARDDYALARQILAEIADAAAGRQLADYEDDVANNLEGKIWDVVVGFSAVLHEKRRLEPAAATALVRALCAEHLADDPETPDPASAAPRSDPGQDEEISGDQ